MSAEPCVLSWSLPAFGRKSFSRGLAHAASIFRVPFVHTSPCPRPAPSNTVATTEMNACNGLCSFRAPSLTQAPPLSRSQGALITMQQRVITSTEAAEYTHSVAPLVARPMWLLRFGCQERFVHVPERHTVTHSSFRSCMIPVGTRAAPSPTATS